MKRLWITAAALLLTGCSSATGVTPGVTPVATVTAAPPGDSAEVATGLAVPWDIAFAADGSALVTERDSARLLSLKGGQVSELGTIAGVEPGGEGGLMGVAVKEPHVFVYFTAAQDNRIVRYELDGLKNPTVLVEGIPKAGIHNGGGLGVGPDGFLYASTGDAGERPQAQERDSLGGKILRMTLDGKPAPGNPFGTLVYSYGHRNVQGLAWDSKGRLYASEFGANAFDEVNLIEPGANYGWPEVEGQGDNPAYKNPIATWSTDQASPSGLAFAGGSLWMAGLRGQKLWQIPLSDDGTAGEPVARFDGQYGRLRAVAATPDGTLWFGTSNHDGRGSPRQGDDRVLELTP
ncbi:PQQ-dependent sugar dehydrogenase [Nonomuraea soli]|uniref:Glucose/arabinose dehydrogenase n=1 Tax=Nonomuraea soli TaxID=1032476 RepID=A0A7W0CNA1_9ACTN|nr:PQQ-dependent sugar dehydrogenase [Nonomuraea soli]MBA2894080.1 glucose/arabinose dehydrogenase [Nonomuraea soli]